MMEENLLSVLRQKRNGLSFHQIARLMRLGVKDQKKLRRALKELQKRGVVLKKKDSYFVSHERRVIRGEFLSSSRGFGFVRPETKEMEDVFIPGRHSLGALTGDIVEVLYEEKGERGKPEGRIVRILEKGRETALGIYDERFGQPFFVLLDSGSSEEIPLASKGSFTLKPGMIIEVKRDSWTLTSVLGLPDEPGVDTQVVIKQHNLAAAFLPVTAMEAQQISRRILAQDRAGRKDYRRWRTMTIDGETAQDFDDAVSVKKLASGPFLLGVHIADVSHYVKPGSALDKEALQRATSVYFPDLTLPMLPEELSNDLSSLRPRKTRLTFSVLLEIDQNGRVVKSEFHPSIIKTAERMTYTSVFKIFEGDADERRKFATLVPDLLLMREVASLLRKRREDAGSLNFDLLEPELVYREGKLQQVAAFEANEAHHLIEEFMVAANEAVASALTRKSLQALYRVHPAPGLADLEELRGLLEHFGFFLPKPEKVAGKDLQRILKQVEGKPEEKFIQFQVLRSLRIAVYSAENTGHYGLAKKEYTHFTSPIRRYPDLIVHRLIKAAIRGEKLRIPALPSLALHCSERERAADEAEKQLVEWRIFRFLKSKLGEEFEGLIVDITKAGVVVEFEDYFVDGLIPYADLDGDYYHRRSQKTLVGRRSGRKFDLGERVKVILASVDPIRRRMGLVLSRDSSGVSR
jgi:ribonuclease R